MHVVGVLRNRFAYSHVILCMYLSVSPPVMCMFLSQFWKCYHDIFVFSKRVFVISSFYSY